MPTGLSQPAAVPPQAYTPTSYTQWRLAQKQQQRIAIDKWWLGCIILERFTGRFFSEKVGWLPGYTNFLDYPLMILFAIYVVFTVRGRSASTMRSGFVPITFALLFVIALSAVINLDRLHPGAVTLFTVGLLEPLAFMGLAFLLAPGPPEIRFVLKVLYFVGWLQIVVVFLFDLPIFLATNNPDYISGTFGANPYQLVFFLMTWNVLILSRPPSKQFRAFQIFGVVCLQALVVVIILLAQFRAILPFAALTWILTYILVNRRPAKGLLAAGLGFCLFAVLFTQISVMFPALKWNDVLELASRSDETIQSGKVQSIINLGRLFANHPQFLFTGTGPGTYASRGFRTFSVAGEDDVANQLYRKFFKAEIYATDVSTRYVLPIMNNFAFGSATAAVPWFSYNAIPAELGVLGLSMVLAIYAKATRTSWRSAREDNELTTLGRWIFIGLILLLQMALLENWLENSRLTVPIWMMFGVLLANRQAQSIVTKRSRE